MISLISKTGILAACPAVFASMERMEFDLKELHTVQLNLFKNFCSVCRDNDLSYFLGFGTLLGAVREHGIIEWDDGIDIVMPCPDYNKLCQLPQTIWQNGYFLQTYDTDPAFNRYYAKLRDSNTTLILAEDAGRDMNHGIPINIYPVINLANDEGERQSQLRNAKLYKTVTEGNPAGSDDTLLHTLSTIFLGITTEPQKVKTRDYLKKEILKFEEEKTNCCFVLAGNKSLDLVLFKTWFSSAVLCDFAGIQANIPAGWHEWLKLRYGDYMRKPISELQGNQTSNFITLNPRKPYTYYKGKTYCV